MIFELQLRPIKHKTCRESWNLVIMTMMGFLYPWNSHFMGESLSQNPETRWTNLLYSFLPKYFNVFATTSCWWKALGICDEDIGLIFSMRLDGRKEIQLKKSAWSIFIQISKPASYPLSRRIIKFVKQTLTKFSCIFNMKFDIFARNWKFKKLQTIWWKVKYKLPKTGSRMTFIPHFHPLLMKTFNQVWANQSGFLDVWKGDWALRLSGKWFQMWRPKGLKYSYAFISKC